MTAIKTPVFADADVLEEVGTDILTDVLNELGINVEQRYRVVVFNDDVNSFEHVIKTFIKVCKHTLQQAEQCAMIIHYNGKCTVKQKLSEQKANDIATALCDAGLTAEVQEEN